MRRFNHSSTDLNLHTLGMMNTTRWCVWGRAYPVRQYDSTVPPGATVRRQDFMPDQRHTSILLYAL